MALPEAMLRRLATVIPTTYGLVGSRVAAEVEDMLATAWRAGHDAGRDYQADGWNSDAHDPEDDNPFERIKP